jgi:hypothetical protein
LTLGGAATVAKVRAVLNQGAGTVNLPGLVYLGDPATPFALDSDGDGFIDVLELGSGSNPDDGDSDDDGLVDGMEPSPQLDPDADGRISVLDPDADGDGILDGTEAGITLPGPGTDVSRGFFRADADPSHVTDSRNPDSDGGGAPDGAEDRNLSGGVDAGEINPLDPRDDPPCAASRPPELDAPPVSGLRVSVDGPDLLIRWSDATAADPCILYHLYVATNALPKSRADAFTLLATTGQPVFRHVGAAVDGAAHDYLVVGFSLSKGEGPMGHYGR